MGSETQLLSSPKLRGDLLKFKYSLCKKETEECLSLIRGLPKVTLGAEEGSTREWAITFQASWQGVHWHSVAVSAEGVQIAHHHHCPSVPLLLHSVPDRQILI